MTKTKRRKRLVKSLVVEGKEGSFPTFFAAAEDCGWAYASLGATWQNQGFPSLFVYHGVRVAVEWEFEAVAPKLAEVFIKPKKKVEEVSEKGPRLPQVLLREPVVHGLGRWL
jgi:hypothetical protein